jgi:hypothetical protein
VDSGRIVRLGHLDFGSGRDWGVIWNFLLGLYWFWGSCRLYWGGGIGESAGTWTAIELIW